MRWNNAILLLYSVFVSFLLVLRGHPPPVGPCRCDCRCPVVHTIPCPSPPPVVAADEGERIAHAEGLTVQGCLDGQTSQTGWPRPFFNRSYQQLAYFSWAAAKHASEIPLSHFIKVLQYVSGAYEEMNVPKETHLYAVYNKRPKVFIDVGANVGFFSVETILAFQPPCARWRGEMRWRSEAEAEWRRKNWLPFQLGFDYGHSSLVIHAIEPKEENWKLLSDTLRSFCQGGNCSERHNSTRRSNYGQRRIQVSPVLELHTHRYAVSENSGNVRLYTRAKSQKDRNNFGGDELASLIPDHKKEHQAFELVPAISLDAFWAANGNGNSEIFVLKIDAEKHELAVLHGARGILRNRTAGIVLWECSNVNATRAVVDLLDGYGYYSYLVGLRSLIALTGHWSRVFDRGLWANCASIARDHPLLPMLESVYALDVILNWNKPKKYFWNVKD